MCNLNTLFSSVCLPQRRYRIFLCWICWILFLIFPHRDCKRKMKHACFMSHVYFIVALICHRNSTFTSLNYRWFGDKKLYSWTVKTRVVTTFTSRCQCWPAVDVVEASRGKMVIYQTVRVSALTNVILFGPCGSVDSDSGVRMQFPSTDAMWAAGYHFNWSFSWTVETVAIRHKTHNLYHLIHHSTNLLPNEPSRVGEFTMHEVGSIFLLDQEKCNKRLKHGWKYLVLLTANEHTEIQAPSIIPVMLFTY